MASTKGKPKSSEHEFSDERQRDRVLTSLPKARKRSLLQAEAIGILELGNLDLKSALLEAARKKLEHKSMLLKRPHG